MKKLLIGTALGTMLLAGAANASITITATPDALNTYDAGQVLLDDFDGYVDANVSFVGNITSPQNPVVNSAAPPWSGGTSICCDSDGNSYLADNTNYESVQGNQTSVFTATHGLLSSFSFYMGSPDEYNSITFIFAGGAGSQTISGNALWGGSPAGTGDRDQGYRVSYDFGGQDVYQIVFTSGADAFEADNFAGTLAVPEPATWALMIMGFGTAGAMLRRRKAILA